MRIAACTFFFGSRDECNFHAVEPTSILESPYNLAARTLYVPNVTFLPCIHPRFTRNTHLINKLFIRSNRNFRKCQKLKMCCWVNRKYFVSLLMYFVSLSCVCVFFSIFVWTKLNQPNWGAISKYMRCVIYRIYGWHNSRF